MKLLVVHGGGPTAVLNSSLYGLLVEAKNQNIQEIYAAKNGFRAILNGDLKYMADYSDQELEKMLITPGTVIGSSRDVVEEQDYEQAAKLLIEQGFTSVIFNGGNGTMDTCGRLAAASNNRLQVIGIPKTIDNDLAMIDHAPGFGSAAKFIANCTKEVGEDVKSLPIHVSIIETMGRNAGWIAAASALAKEQEDDAPHLIYLPEVPFDESQFLKDVQEQITKHKGIVIVVSEGLKNADNTPIVKPIIETGRAVYYGDVGTHLANLIIEKLGYKARSEKPGIISRTSMSYLSNVDQQEAIAVGKYAIKALVASETNKMVGIRRKQSDLYEVEYTLLPIHEVMLHENTLPEKYINQNGNGVTDEFINWCKPLIDGDLPSFFKLKEIEE